MKIIKPLEDYISESIKIIELAGIAIIFNNKILLCYPKKAKDVQEWSIPKGKVDKNESYRATAIRETFEEIGIILKEKDLKKGKDYSYVTKSGDIKWMRYYIYNAKSLEELGLKKEKIPLKNLQIEEMKDADFFSYKKAKKLIKWEYENLLNILKNENYLK